MKYVRLPRFLAALAITAAMLAAVAVAQDAKPNPATSPSPFPADYSAQPYYRINARVKKGNVDLIFIGDSITQNWDGINVPGADKVWNKYYGNRNAVNMGITSEGTQHTLWRLDHGNIDGISPKLAVLMIGTNNAGNTGHTSEQIVEGVTAVVKKLRTKLPTTKVLVLAIFPRGPNTHDHLRQVVSKANEGIAKLADDKMVFFLDIGPKFLAADGTLSKDIMPDYLHPNAKGHAIWAEAIEPTVAKLMGEK